MKIFGAFRVYESKDLKQDVKIKIMKDKENNTFRISLPLLGDDDGISVDLCPDDFEDLRNLMAGF